GPSGRRSSVPPGTGNSGRWIWGLSRKISCQRSALPSSCRAMLYSISPPSRTRYRRGAPGAPAFAPARAGTTARAGAARRGGRRGRGRRGGRRGRRHVAGDQVRVAALQHVQRRDEHLRVLLQPRRVLTDRLGGQRVVAVELQQGVLELVRLVELLADRRERRV